MLKLGVNRNMYELYIKRKLDVILSLTALILLIPLFVILALLIRIKIGKGVIFKQKRVGKDEKVFTLYKFRTMNNKRDKKGKLLPDEQRLSEFGKKLRSTSLDELPELINILKGDMSIVGPRPLFPHYLPYYTKEERLRHKIKPGLTGLAQINGRNTLGWAERFQYDIDYVKNITFLNDLKIIYKTFVVTINRLNVLSGKELTMPNLDEERSDTNAK
ncbi:MAG: sugar transferase [Anaerocolumna sp.]|jgi:lipopolysaccharide/colanic/teichoic acid biosynthesis glycosyltransferase|nr:sugar transferase [Anaerocolumna sp.]